MEARIKFFNNSRRRYELNIIEKTTPLTVSTKIRLGKILLILRDQNRINENLSFANSVEIIEVIRKPESTKKISTPIKPLSNNGICGAAWFATTASTAIPRNPSISLR